MAFPDYAPTRDEQTWMVPETTFNTLVEPAVTDAVVTLPGVSLPPVLREFAPSAERTPGAGIAALIKRKKRPGAFTIPVYVKGADAPGSAPSYGIALKRGFGQETIVGGTSVTYALLAAIEETSLSIWHWKGNEMSGFRGCLVNTIGLELSGSDEGKITLGGFTGNEVFAGVSTLNGAVDAIVTSFVVNNARRFQVGPGASDVIFLQIESEIVKLTAVNYATSTLTVVRAQKGSAAAAHANATEIGPWKPAADTDPADIISPITLGSVTLGTITVRGISFTQEINNQLEPRIDEYGQDTLTGYRRTGKRTVTGALRAYARQAVQDFLTNLERETVEDAAITAGQAGTGTALLTVNIDRMRLNDVTLDGGGPEFVFEFSYQALASAPTADDESNWVYT